MKLSSQEVRLTARQRESAERRIRMTRRRQELTSRIRKEKKSLYLQSKRSFGTSLSVKGISHTSSSLKSLLRSYCQSLTSTSPEQFLLTLESFIAASASASTTIDTTTTITTTNNRGGMTTTLISTPNNDNGNNDNLSSPPHPQQQIIVIRPWFTCARCYMTNQRRHFEDSLLQQIQRLWRHQEYRNEFQRREQGLPTLQLKLKVKRFRMDQTTSGSHSIGFGSSTTTTTTTISSIRRRTTTTTKDEGKR
mmetsp:Transcript_4033/g.4681  ORF Transcript_4033/g.4681 Transcript_4033/m.4681 type:complete len:250 (+) Transcript_4033:48-797(+)